jgi:hypothetical protein
MQVKLLHGNSEPNAHPLLGTQHVLGRLSGHITASTNAHELIVIVAYNRLNSPSDVIFLVE